MTKLEKLQKMFPKLYKANVDPFMIALLTAIANSDYDIDINITECNKQLFITLASDKYLESLGSSYGVEKDPDINPDDDSYRGLISAMAFYPKQTRGVIYSLFDSFFNPLYLRANLESTLPATYDISNTINLTGTVSFIQGRDSVFGTGTLFTVEVAAGDYIKVASNSNSYYVKVDSIVSNTEIKLSKKYSFASLLTTATRNRSKTFIVSTETLEDQEITIEPTSFADLTAVTADEIIDYFNTNLTGITASVMNNPATGNNTVNIRTDVIGIEGWIRPETSDLTTILGFVTTKKTFYQMKQSVGLFEINPNEIVLTIPSEIPVIRRSLKGSHHWNDSGLGTITAKNIVAMTATCTFDYPVIADQFKGYKFSQEKNEYIIDSHPAGQAGVVVTMVAGSDLTDLDAAGEFACLDIIGDNPYVGSFLYDSNTPWHVITGRCKLNETIIAGDVKIFIAVTDASDIPNEQGYLVFDFGKENEEALIPYRSRPNNSTLGADPFTTFTKDHAIGEWINVIYPSACVPDPKGSSYAVYIVNDSQALTYIQELIQKVIAAGIKIRWIISDVNYFWHDGDNTYR